MNLAEIPRIVIIGGGFAGVECARTLRNCLSSADWEIVLFNRENHMVFHPLLAEVTGSSVNPDVVAPPLRQLLRDVHCRTESVTELDLANRQLGFEGNDGHVGRLAYDHVVVACGRVVNLAAVPGMSDHSFPFKTIGDAMALRAHVIQRLEQAEVCSDRERRRWLLSFIIVGGGFSGVEVAGEINDLLRDSRRFYPHVPKEDITVTLVHSGEQLLPEIGPSLRDVALRKMVKAGVSFVLKTRAAAATGEGIWLNDGRSLRGGTVVNTIGTGPTVLAGRMPCPNTKGVLHRGGLANSGQRSSLGNR